MWFCSKHEATDFHADIFNDDNFKPFKYKAKLLRNTEIMNQSAPNSAHGIMKNEAIAVLLKYLSNFWRSLETPLINCKEELKLRWTKHCVLSVGGTDNANGNNDSNNIMFTIKDTKLYVPITTLSTRDNQKLS